ncbi:MAG: hypothetical protein ACR2L2_17915 [Acidobacteriota bacterium]
MKSIVVRVSVALLAVAALWAESPRKSEKPLRDEAPPISAAVDKGANWLASVQGANGGWGQDGGGTSRVGTGENLEPNGNSGSDVANTAVAALALLQAGKQYQPNVERAIAFILQRVEASPTDGLAVTDTKGTQIQRKLGPYIDTFLTSMLLAQADGTLSTRAQNARVRQGLEKCVAKIQQNQKSDGSWNIAGGWAPVLGTSLASRSLFEAQQKGVAVERRVMARADDYTVNAMKSSADSGRAGGVAGGLGGGVGSGSGGGTPSAATADSAGVDLYQSAQALEQLSHTDEDRKKNANEISAIRSKLADSRFVAGFGSIGGEEFFSYLNLSDGMKRAGGEEWNQWHAKITKKIVDLQNNDGTWAGHHCITGRVAVTSAAILNLTVNRAD